MSIRITMASAFVLGSLVIAGCGDGSSSGPAAKTPGGTASAATWLLADAPAGAIDIAALKKTAAEGDRVVMRGRIGGRSEPFTEGAAVFVMMDPAIPSCADLHADKCPKPWDYCCETPESIVTNSATVQLVDAAGTPVSADLRTHGFEPLDEVIVVGTVAPRPSDAVLIIRAESLYRPPTTS